MQCETSLTILTINYWKLTPVEIEFHLTRALNGPLSVIRSLANLGLFTITANWLDRQLLESCFYYGYRNHSYIAELINLAAEFNVELGARLKDEIRLADETLLFDREDYLKWHGKPLRLLKPRLICDAGKNYYEKRKYTEITN